MVAGFTPGVTTPQPVFDATGCAAPSLSAAVAALISPRPRQLSGDAQQLVRLQRDSPLGMPQAVFNRPAGVLCPLGAIHWLQEELGEVERGKQFGLGAGLWVDELQLVALRLHQWRTGFRTDADPIDSLGTDPRSIGLDRNLESRRMQAGDQGRVKLQQRFSPGAHHVGPAGCGGIKRPELAEMSGEFGCSLKSPPTGAVGPHELRVAELADRSIPVGFQAGPEIAPGEPAEDRRPPRPGPFPLQRVEGFFDRVRHGGNNGPERGQKSRAETRYGGKRVERIFLGAELASRVLNPRIESLRMEFKTNLRNAQGSLRPTAVNGPYRAGAFRGDLTQGVALG